MGLTGAHLENRSSVHLNNSLLSDSAFCELDTDSVTEKDVICPDQLRLLHVVDEDSIHCGNWTENLSSVGFYYDKHHQSSTSVSIDSHFVEELSGGEGSVESSSVEDFETSDTESQGCSAKYSSSSSTVELSSTCSLSDKFITFPDRDESHENEQVADDGTLSDGSRCSDMLVASSSNTSVGSESQLSQHKPLVVFIIGLFVGLSLGFFTCKYVADIVCAVMLSLQHTEIVFLYMNVRNSNVTFLFTKT